MSLIIDAIAQFADAPERRIAIVRQQRRISYRELWDAVQCWCRQLRKSRARAVACCVSDRLRALEITLACQAIGVTSLVLSGNCTADTLRQLVLYNGIECVLSDRSDLLTAASLTHAYCEETGVYRFLSPVLQQALLPGNCAILSLNPTARTGAQLLSVSQQAIDHTTRHLARLRDELGIERHLSLPFAPALCETLCGQYATLIAGGCCVLPEQSSSRHFGNECTALINDYARLLPGNDIQSVLIPGNCRAAFLDFSANNAAASALKMLLIAGQPQAELPDVAMTTPPQPMIYHLWGTPGHALPYALLRPAARQARLLPHCKVSSDASDRLYLHAGASVVFADDDLLVKNEQLDIGVTGRVDDSDFLHLADVADRQHGIVEQRSGNPMPG